MARKQYPEKERARQRRKARHQYDTFCCAECGQKCWIQAGRWCHRCYVAIVYGGVSRIPARQDDREERIAVYAVRAERGEPLFGA
jgi:hypothetical protein